MASGSRTPPSLHELCCRIICDEDLYLSVRTVLDVLDFAKTWNVGRLQHRAEAFVASTLPTLQEMHGDELLRRALGDDCYATLRAEQEDATMRVRRHSLLGAPVAKQEVPNAVLAPVRTASDRETWPYEQLRTGVEWPAGVGPDEREQWLSNPEFAAVFGMPRERFLALPAWKRTTLRREKDLF